MGENNITCTYIFTKGHWEGQQCQRPVEVRGTTFCKIHDKRNVYHTSPSRNEEYRRDLFSSSNFGR